MDTTVGCYPDKNKKINPLKKRPKTIPVFGPGKWLIKSRALKVGIYAGDVALPFKR